jgi:hypothetical protein
MNPLYALIENLFRKAPDHRAPLVILSAMFLDLKSTGLTSLRIQDLPPSVRELHLNPDTESWLLSRIQRLSINRSPDELVLKGRNNHGETPVSRMTLWRILSPVVNIIKGVKPGRVLRTFKSLRPRIRAFVFVPPRDPPPHNQDIPQQTAKPTPHSNDPPLKNEPQVQKVWKTLRYRT